MAPSRRASRSACPLANALLKDFAGPLTIKSATDGTVSWKCAGREHLVDRDSFLVLNPRTIFHGDRFADAGLYPVRFLAEWLRGIGVRVDGPR
jgi:hypothetical protein